MDCSRLPLPGIPQSLKSHEMCGILKISGKVVEFILKMTKVMEKSFDFEIRTKSLGNVMEIDQ